jgi:hypothetical protein
MYSRCCALFSACILIVAFGGVYAQTTSSEILLAAHQDWIGHANQSVTRDGSVLNEYIAQSSSVNMEGALLLISMIPRFTCVPVVSIAINDSTIMSRAADVEWVAAVDEQTVDYPFILDTDGPQAQFTLSSPGADQIKLRSVLDLASWVIFKWSVDSVTPQLSDTTPTDMSLEASGNIDFSLLGSRRTLNAMEEMCRSHTPIPLTN